VLFTCFQFISLRHVSEKDASWSQWLSFYREITVNDSFFFFQYKQSIFFLYVIKEFRLTRNFTKKSQFTRNGYLFNEIKRKKLGQGLYAFNSRFLPASYSKVKPMLLISRKMISTWNSLGLWIFWTGTRAIIAGTKSYYVHFKQQLHLVTQRGTIMCDNWQKMG